MLAVALVVFAPLGDYIMKHWQQFMRRTATVSIFNTGILQAMGGRYIETVNGEQRVKPPVKLYMDNLRKTLLMFNWYGDGNPRHNSNRRPMLDFALGTLFVLGFGYSALRIFRPFYFMLFALFFAMLQAGLFSIESPQAYRTIGVIPLVLIFSLVAAAKLIAITREKSGMKKEKIIAVVIAVFLLISGAENYDTHFNKHRKDFGAWAEFSIDEWHMGKYLRELGPDWMGIVVPGWAESYTFEFMTYPHRNYVKFDASEWIPIKSRIYKNYVYILDMNYAPLLPFLEEMYPGGRYTDFKHKFTNRILYFAYEVPYNEVKKQQENPVKKGLTGKYYKDQGKTREELKDMSRKWQGTPVFTRVDPFILFNWTVDPILMPFSVEWTGKIKIDREGRYSFETRSNDYSDLYINGKKVLENPGGEGRLVPANGEIYLKKGRHDIRVRYYESTTYSKMQLWWKTPDSAEWEVVSSAALFPE